MDKKIESKWIKLFEKIIKQDREILLIIGRG